VTPRQQALGAALLATLGLTLWLAMSGDADAPVGPAPRRQAAPAPSGLAAAPALAEAPASTPASAGVARPPWPELSEAALAAWSAPAAPVAAPAAAAPAHRVAPAAPAAVAPQFGYTLIGSLQQAGGWSALLAGPQHSVAVRAGDIVDGQWRIDQITPAGVDGTWLPQGLPFRLRYLAS
jgi:hypothetical protein